MRLTGDGPKGTTGLNESANRCNHAIEIDVPNGPCIDGAQANSRNVPLRPIVNQSSPGKALSLLLGLVRISAEG